MLATRPAAGGRWPRRRGDRRGGRRACGEALEAGGVRTCPPRARSRSRGAVRRLAPGCRHRQHAHDRSRGRHRGRASVLRAARPAVVATRHFAKPHGWVGPVPVAPLVRRGIDAQIAISRAVAEAIDGPSTVVHSGVEGRPLADAATAHAVRAHGPAARAREAHRTSAYARSRRPDCRDDGWALEIAGTGSEQASLEALAGSLGIADAVRLPRISHRRRPPDGSCGNPPRDVPGRGSRARRARSDGRRTAGRRGRGRRTPRTARGPRSRAPVRARRRRRCGDEAALARRRRRRAPAARTLGSRSASGRDSRFARRPPAPKPCTGACDERPRGGLARGLGQRVATQPAPRRRAPRAATLRCACSSSNRRPIPRTTCDRPEAEFREARASTRRGDRSRSALGRSAR